MKNHRNQQKLDFGTGVPAPANRVETSVAAADSLEPTLTSTRKRVYDFIKARLDDGATCYEVEIALQLRHSTASGRIFELNGAYEKFPKALIRDSGKRRKTDSGRNAIVWVAI